MPIIFIVKFSRMGHHVKIEMSVYFQNRNVRV
jgi:hypothetical protein